MKTMATNKPLKRGKVLQAKTSLKRGTALKAKTGLKKPSKGLSVSSKSTVNKLKKTADKYFSLYVRLRDSNSRGIGRCITCDTPKHYKEAQAGHFVSRSNNLLRYDEENVNLQCVGCNMFKSGEQYLYSVALDMKYGDGTAKKLMAQRHETHRWTVAELEQIIHDAKTSLEFYEKALAI